MSYQNVFFGDLKKKNFYSNGTDLSSDIIENVYEVIYFPNKFTNHELLEFSSLNLGVNIRVYNEDKTVMVFYLTEYDPLFYDSDIKRNIDNSIGHIQINIDKGDKTMMCNDIEVLLRRLNKKDKGKKRWFFNAEEYISTHHELE